MPGFEELGGEDVSLVSHPDPVVLELNRLQNQLKEKERELGKAQSEIRALRATEVLKDKALEELGSEVRRLEGKLRSSENHIEQKNLDIKKLTDEKKEALAAQYAAEATLRRVYADQKDDDSVPIELVIAPLEAELKMHKNEMAALQEDKRALERLTKSKEAALLEAERILRSALERALIVEEVQNQNFELRRQIEICQEENKILDKTNRQKVLEVEKLSQTIKDLEEAILAGGAAANTIRDYRRQISELNEEKRTLERELARVKVSANRIATVVANEWKDEKDKVMPVKQWLEERRMLQAEMQKLKDKLAISERAAKAEAQVKEKLKLRLKTLEEGLKHVHSLSINTKGSPKNEKSNNFFGILSKMNKNAMVDDEMVSIKGITGSNEEKKELELAINDCEDMVSGFLYDRLQKEVISLRKFCDLKDSTLNSKDEEIKMLMRKVETLTRAMEVESKKMKREAAIREKDSALTKVDEKIRSTNSSKRSATFSTTPSSASSLSPYCSL
ncbi:UNVERIFIED_CONTAM: Microtubule-associated protein 70-5 [Sesamum latifolium]|uniref:Microtubule-associated protein 70-5 n=1 Tax=Sesamum latifolium TaxID=2727402 RepID=A0AAW2WNF3_9LAMI